MRRAFLSVYDKTNICEFAKNLKHLGFEIISTGGTAQTLKNNGIGVTNVSDVTGFPECLNGRVKTLHPKIHAGILAVRNNPEHMRQLDELNISMIDIVCVNLYPFAATIAKENVSLEEAGENIDIGGPTMLRAAAKNFKDVSVIVDSADYDTVINELKTNGDTIEKTKFYLAAKVFEHTAAYDALIAKYLMDKQNIHFPQKLTLTYEKVMDMRYGENPHQGAVFYREAHKTSAMISDCRILNGKPLSYNNINDLNAAVAALNEFSETTVVAVKHANPCAVACADNIYNAYAGAYTADPVSIFGGIVVANVQIDEKTAEDMSKIFLEIVAAPAFAPAALEILKQKKNLRILELPADIKNASLWDLKSVAGGILIQSSDCELFENMQVVTKLAPDEKQIEDLLFAWKVVKHLKSNAIAIARDKKTQGLGMGQVSRIWAAQNALNRSNHTHGAVMSSDAFFPFPDCVEEAHKAGITCIIQPGGSVNDSLSTRKCDEYGMAMVFTNMRHFKH